MIFCSSVNRNTNRLEIKDLAEDCDLGKIDTESLLCHLFLRGLHSSEAKLQEKIILDSEGGELKDQKVTSLITKSEMYKSLSRNSSKVNEVKGNIKNNVKQQGDKSDNKKTCFKCGEEGHFKSSCKKQVSCDDGNIDSHSNKTCFSQKGKVNK